MRQDSFTQEIQKVHQQVAEMKKRSQESTLQTQDLLEVAFQNLDVTLEELQAAQEELTLQNEALLNARQSVEQERRRYQDLFESAPDAYIVTDARGIIQEANHAATALFQVTPKFLRGKPLAIFVAPEARRAFRTHMTELEQGDPSTGGPPAEWILPLRSPKRDDFSAALTRAVVRGSDGQAVTLRWLLRDVTRRRQAEEALRTSEARFQAFMDNSPAVAFLKDEQERIVYFNKPAALCYGLLEDCLGKTVFDLYPPEIAGPLHEHDRAVLESHQTMEWVETVPMVDAEVREWLTYKFPVPDASGQRFIGGMAVDVTGRKRAEQALQSSEKLFRALVEKGWDGIALLDAHGTIFYTSPAITHILGYDTEELIGQNVMDFIHPDDLPQMQANLHEFVTQPKTSTPTEYRNRHKDGSWRWIESTNTNLLADSSIQAIVCNFRDITERKEAEEALRQSEERFAKIFRASPVVISIAGLQDECFLDVNDIFLRETGYHRKEVIGRTPRDLGMWVETEDHLKTLEQLRENGLVYNVDLQWRMKSGEVRETLTSMELIELDGKECILALGVDITERQRAERVSRGQTAALARTLLTLAEKPDLDMFLGQVLAAIHEQFHASYTHLGFYNAEDNTVSMRLTCDGDQTVPSKRFKHPRAEPTPPENWPFWQEMNRTRQPLVAEDVIHYPGLQAGSREWMLSHGIQTVLLLPLLLGEQIIGWLSVDSRERRRYQAEEIALAQALAQQTTLAVQLTRLAEQAQQTAILQERNRLAREIHDTLAQGFTGVILQLEAAEDALSDEPEAAKAHITRARTLAGQSLAEARRSVQALRPQALDQDDLAAVLKSLARQMTADTSVKIDFQVRGTPLPLPSEIEHNLLRIAAEAVTNALRHAKAHTIYMELEFDGEPENPTVKLSVQDDGRGFDPSNPLGIAGIEPLSLKTSGFGLTSMQERAEHIGARLTITSQIGQGTHVAVVVPFDRP